MHLRCGGRWKNDILIYTKDQCKYLFHSHAIWFPTAVALKLDIIRFYSKEVTT